MHVTSDRWIDALLLFIVLLSSETMQDLPRPYLWLVVMPSSFYARVFEGPCQLDLKLDLMFPATVPYSELMD